MIESARQLVCQLEKTPYAGRLGFLGGEITSEAVTASVPYSDELANAQGYVHGGVAASLSIWAAMIGAVASDRDHAASAYPVSASISYLFAAREEALEASARIASRGRDLAHVAVDVSSERGRLVASALLVVRMFDAIAKPRPPRLPGGSLESGPPDIRRRSSPFSKGMGIGLRAHDVSSAQMTMRTDCNEGLGGAADAGALVALADTCAALACLPSLDERLTASATLSLSAVFGEPLRAAALAEGHVVADSGALRSALVQVGPDSARGAAHKPAMTACVAYRFVTG